MRKKQLITVPIIIGVSVLSFGSISINCSDILASTNGKTAANAISWAKSSVGKSIDYDHVYGAQCVDLIKAYYSFLGAPEPRGNGSDYATNTLPKGWKRFKGVQPAKGDILIYTGGYGNYGHVAIYESDYSTYHQNFNSHHYVERVTYKYNGNWDIKYWGVIRPDFASSAYVSPTIQKKSLNGLNKVSGAWRYYTNNKIDTSFTGLAKNAYGWWYVKNGKIDLTYTGLAKNTYGWWYVAKGKVNMSYTGMAKNKYGWWYVTKGKVNMSYTGMANNKYGWWYIKNGKLDTSFTGIAKNKYGSWYIKNGKLDTSFTGIAKNKYGRWYMKNGKLMSNYSGKITLNNKTYTIKKGKVI